MVIINKLDIVSSEVRQLHKFDGGFITFLGDVSLDNRIHF